MKRSVLPCWRLSILYKSAFQRLAAAIVSVCFFAAAVSVPVMAIEAQGYTDVNPESIWYEDIMEATEEGIVSGIGNGQFAPDRPVTMLEFATMLGRYLNRFEGLDAYWLESPLLMINAYLDANNGHAAGDSLTRRGVPVLYLPQQPRRRGRRKRNALTIWTVCLRGSGIRSNVPPRWV